MHDEQRTVMQQVGRCAGGCPEVKPALKMLAAPSLSVDVARLPKAIGGGIGEV